MKNRVVTQHQINAFRRFYKVLPRSDDETLLVLKIHLLIEEQLRHLLGERVANPEVLTEAEFDCFQVICLCEAICGSELDSKHWKALRKMNKLRNDIAHQLEPTGIRDRMAHIVSLLSLSPDQIQMVETASEGQPQHQFSFAASILFNRVAALVKKPSPALLQLVAREQGAP